eukprot:3075199-Amphidinium_carterae.3
MPGSRLESQERWQHPNCRAPASWRLRDAPAADDQLIMPASGRIRENATPGTPSECMDGRLLALSV